MECKRDGIDGCIMTRDGQDKDQRDCNCLTRWLHLLDTKESLFPSSVYVINLCSRFVPVYIYLFVCLTSTDASII